MKAKYSMFALAVIVASGLAACDQNHPKSLKVQAEVAKASDSPEQQKAAYERTRAATFAEEDSLREQGITFTFRDDVARYAPFFTWIAKEKRASVRQSLKKMIENSETEIGLAKALKDNEKLKKSEETKAKATEVLRKLDADIASEEAKTKEIEKMMNEPQQLFGD